jgi:hypothetical protein
VPKAPQPEVELSECCHATIGYDAWVDSNGEVCGGPYDHNICLNCGMEDPAVWDGKARRRTRNPRTRDAQYVEMVITSNTTGNDRAK